MLDIALVGCGAIGAGVLELIAADPALRVGQVLTHAPDAPRVRDALARLAPQARSLRALAPDAPAPDLLVECAGHAAIEQHVLPALERGIDCLIVSAGALTDTVMLERVEAAARRGGAQARLLSGAVGAIDALAAARLGGLEHVRYTGRKPPRAWQGTAAEQDWDLSALQQAQLIFSGSAREAARRFPKNANVAATVALASLGLDRVQVQLYADPAISGNLHRIDARGGFGELSLSLQGRPLASNPKTSALTVYSVARALLNHAQAIAI
ncbi:aspartate dehydrogenase [Chromobacterium haemolyticum]|nr:aspartate dehydrogenase [Chromobacterium haemolyticum]